MQEEKDTLAMLSGEVARVLNKETVDVDTPIGDLGVDSMRVVELLLICDQLYGCPIQPEELNVDQFTSLRELDRQFGEMARHFRETQAAA